MPNADSKQGATTYPQKSVKATDTAGPSWEATYTVERFHRDLERVTGEVITAEIEGDPKEAAVLRKRRADAREGKVVRRRRDGTKSSTKTKPGKT
jgi:ketosteroid isomerase-like protein